MKFTKSYLLLTLTLTALTGFFPALADQIKMKDGTAYEGKITLETDDLVKIEISASSSIKETKMLSRSDIESITKDKPEDLEFNKLQELVPSRSMMGADQYKSMIETGPNTFLQKYPASQHVEAVKKIKATLEEELDKVERGFIKLEEDWISPQERAKFPELVNSRIRFLNMQQVSRGLSHNAIIGAMREFEDIEDNYIGTPAFPRAVELAQNLLPTLAGQLQRMARDVDYRNAEYERTKSQMDDIARQQVEAARAREEAQYKAGLEADKKAGIRWVRLNARSKDSIESYGKMVAEEIKNLKTYNLEGLKKQGEILADVDDLIVKNNFRLAESKLEEAAKISTRTATEGNAASSKKGGGGTYLAALRAKLSKTKAEEEELAKAREEAAKSQALTQNMKSNPKSKESDEQEETLTVDEEKQKAAEAALAALAASNSKASSGKEEKPAKSKSSKSKSPKKSSKRDDDDDDEREERRERTSSGGGGGGISITRIIQIGTVLLLIAVVAFKYLGVGGKKE